MKTQSNNITPHLGYKMCFCFCHLKLPILYMSNVRLFKIYLHPNWSCVCALFFRSYEHSHHGYHQSNLLTDIHCIKYTTILQASRAVQTILTFHFVCDRDSSAWNKCLTPMNTHRQKCTFSKGFSLLVSHVSISVCSHIISYMKLTDSPYLHKACQMNI